jgi:hypothetical protein
MRKVVIKFTDKNTTTQVWDAISGDPINTITKLKVEWHPNGETIAHIEEDVGFRRKDGSWHFFKDGSGRVRKSKYKALVVPNFEFGDTD